MKYSAMWGVAQKVRGHNTAPPPACFKRCWYGGAWAGKAILLWLAE
jgi:hypothetical protein